MSKIAFITKHFRSETLKIIAVANEIIESYERQGYRLTLRQLYYQFVSRDLIENKERSYKNLGNVISEGRLAGLIDWNAIEDRVRVPRVPIEFDDVEELVDVAIRSYRLPRWEGQEHYVELWVEKDALAGVLAPIASEYHITLMVNRGYSSQSAMFESARRFIHAGKEHDELHLLYLGDHDPSGEDMVRDVKDRLETFGCGLHVKKLALTMEQVEEYDPPPNPAKMSDSRASGYVEKHGASSWEVDALPPEVLSRIITDEITALVDLDRISEIKKREDKDKAALRRVVKQINRA
jgi:hypothetical protein